MELKGKPLTLSAKICGALLAFGGLGLKYSGLVPGLDIDDVLKVAFFVVAIFLPVDASLLVQNLLGEEAMNETLGRVIGFLLTVIIGIFALGGTRLSARKKRFEDIERKAEDAAASTKEETREHIQDVDPRELVASDPDPAARGAERNAIATGFRQRIRDRSREVISRHDGT